MRGGVTVLAVAVGKGVAGVTGPPRVVVRVTMTGFTGRVGLAGTMTAGIGLIGEPLKGESDVPDGNEVVVLAAERGVLESIA